jgi:[citrate (pro-3S)-lyase] ligase
LFQGEGLLGSIITELMNNSFENKFYHLFLFTKPENVDMFLPFGFYPIATTDNVSLMENSKNGIKDYVSKLDTIKNIKNVGCIVANCNPFTNGHRFLVEMALKDCDILHLFILSEDKSLFSTEARVKLAKDCTKDLVNVVVHETSDYIISSATFPTYFLKDTTVAENINCELDLRIFGEYIAKGLNICKRFVGTEPNCIVTKNYNETMKRILPDYGVDVIEIDRKRLGEEVISASDVRKYIKGNDFESVKNIVPLQTMEYISNSVSVE